MPIVEHPLEIPSFFMFPPYPPPDYWYITKSFPVLLSFPPKAKLPLVPAGAAVTLLGKTFTKATNTASAILWETSAAHPETGLGYLASKKVSFGLKTISGSNAPPLIGTSGNICLIAKYTEQLLDMKNNKNIQTNYLAEDISKDWLEEQGWTW